MKTLKISTFLVALTSVFAFSSCLSDDGYDYSNSFRSYVTVTGDSFTGYTFHSDFGCKLIPTPSSVQSVLQGMNDGIKRALITFELVGDETTTQLVAGETYEINLVSDPYSNVAIPTTTTIYTENNTAAIDSLSKKNIGQISSASSNIWAINGYVNAEMILKYDPNKHFYLHTYYNANDVDVANNTLTLKLYYNSNNANSFAQGQGVFSFDLPDEVYNSFQNDTINLILKGKVSQSPDGWDNITEENMSEIGRCKLAKKDLFQPLPY